MHPAIPSGRRSLRMVQRNLIVYRHAWLVIFTGFFEPVFYLLAIGFGVGGMVGQIGALPYAAFVAPGLLASSCMNGAITDGFFNIFFKLHFQKTYDGILATPMRVPDIAFGEMLWALGRGSIYAAGFLTVMLLMGETVGPRLILSPFATLALPAAILVSAAFSAMALCFMTFARKIQDFDTVMGLIFMPMFLLSGAFFPIDLFPAPLRMFVQLTPLYHGTQLLRSLTTGDIGSQIFIHVGYLVMLGIVTFTIAMRRLEHALIK